MHYGLVSRVLPATTGIIVSVLSRCLSQDIAALLASKPVKKVAPPASSSQDEEMIAETSKDAEEEEEEEEEDADSSSDEGKPTPEKPRVTQPS